MTQFSTFILSTSHYRFNICLFKDQMNVVLLFFKKVSKTYLKCPKYDLLFAYI